MTEVRLRMDKMDKLADIVNVSSSHELEDLHGGILNRDLTARSRQAVALLRQRLHNFESVLARRGLRLTVYNDLAVAYELPMKTPCMRWTRWIGTSTALRQLPLRPLSHRNCQRLRSTGSLVRR